MRRAPRRSRPMLEGPTALAFVRGDAALAAKALNDAARAMHALEFKGGLMDSTALSADDVRSIARLPAREVLNAQLVGTIAAPITGLVRTLNALIAGLAIQLQQIAEKGLGRAAEAPRRLSPSGCEAEAPRALRRLRREPEALRSRGGSPEPEPEAAASRRRLSRSRAEAAQKRT